MLLMKNKNLLIKKLDGKTENDGLIYTKEQGAQSWEGEVVATCDQSEYPVGSIVIFYEKAGDDVIINRQKYIMIESENIWATKIGDE
jgi:co-chaperonin GroES (HSP10)